MDAHTFRAPERVVNIKCTEPFYARVTRCPRHKLLAGALSAGLVALVRPSETASRITAAGQAASGEEDEKRWGGLHEEQWREGEKMVETKNRGKERGGIIICINF